MKRVMVKSIALYLLLSLWLFAALPQAINEKIRQSGIATKDISIYIKEAGRGGKVVASLNASKTRSPASVIKVLITYAAVLKLGFNYRWPTRFYNTGKIRHGVLHGDLLIKGYGDPTLGSKDLTKIVSYIKAQGIRRVEGNIVIDRTYFAVGNKDSSGFDNHPYSAYNAMPDAMMFNERISTVHVTPKKHSVRKKTPDYSYTVVNNLQYVKRSCKGKYSWPSVKIDKTGLSPQLILRGQISERCGTRSISQVITKPYKSFYYALKAKMRSEGMTVSGGLKLKKIPSSAHELFTYYSKPLEKIVSKTAKKSNNLYARHLMLLLGAKTYGAPATLKKGRKAIVKILNSKGALAGGTLQIDNGCGLSRVSKMNAKTLATVYDSAYDRYGKRWMNTLSIAGVDGTIKRRFRGTVVRKRAWMKTGTLRRVKNIGGYVKNRAGKTYTAVILVNSPKAKYRGAKLQNEILKWLVKTSAKPSKKRQGTKRASASVEPKSAYYVQVDSFTNKPSKAYLHQIKKAGLPYTLAKDSVYKVLVGPYPDEKKARVVLKQVKTRLNPKAFLTKI